MLTLNEYNHSAAILRADELLDEDYRADCAGEYTTTLLIDPPQLVALRRKHWHEMQEDISDKAFRILGSAVHLILARGAMDIGWIAEQREVLNFEGTTIGVKPDGFSPDGLMIDGKVTSVYVWKKGGRDEWNYQMNIHRWGYEQIGYTVSDMRMEVIFRDWKAREYRHSTLGTYPPKPFLTFDIARIPNEEIEAYIRKRVALHNAAREGNISGCTSEERWEKPTIYAVKKKGQKRAMNNGKFATLEEADAFQKLQTVETEIEYRRGESTRCLDCQVAQWCDQWAQIQAETEMEEL